MTPSRRRIEAEIEAGCPIVDRIVDRGFDIGLLRIARIHIGRHGRARECTASEHHARKNRTFILRPPVGEKSWAIGRGQK